MAKFKGPRFASFLNPPKKGGSSTRVRRTPLPPGQQWLPHQGRRARIRQLRREVKEILELKSEKDIEVRGRITKLVEGEPDTEFAFLHLLHAVKEAMDATGVDFVTAAEYMLDKFAESVEEVPPEVSILRPTD
ncbi:MAG: hypothetical protein E6R03_01860 [Hyphomicrobiaceae bacterium]|nr:MAG: hypothetical protein E6R03_01860 [Hyphomicrobiaceae bacterium]